MKVCKNCGRKLSKSDNKNYSYQCKYCDEYFYEFETINLSIKDLKKEIKYLKNKIKCCSYSKEDLYDLNYKENQLALLENEED